MKFKLIEEFLDNKTYIFRGVAPRGSQEQSNYSQKFKTDLKSRFYSWEAFDGIYMFGDVQVFELLNSSNILNLDNSIPVEDFIEEEGLQDYKSKWLKKIYGVDTLSEIENFDFHDEYHAMQLVATEYLETQTNYDGACWYQAYDTPEEQIQIWNNSIVRRLPYREATKVLDKLARLNPDLYDNTPDEFSEMPKHFNVYKGR